MVKNIVLDYWEDCSFRLADAREIKNLRELNEILVSMDGNMFRHYVNGKRNDFSNWIRDV